jgi:hypothetical protein
MDREYSTATLLTTIWARVLELMSLPSQEQLRHNLSEGLRPSPLSALGDGSLRSLGVLWPCLCLSSVLFSKL